MVALGLKMIEEGMALTRAGYRILLSESASAPAPESLTWDNFNRKLSEAAAANGHSGRFDDFVSYMLFDEKAFSLKGGADLDTALTNRTMSTADLKTYAANYTP